MTRVIRSPGHFFYPIPLITLFLYLWLMLDYIVVGFGLAGSAFCKVLEEKGKSFKVFDDSGPSASLIAAGLYNPVVIKRLNPVWKAAKLLEDSDLHYKQLREILKTDFYENIPVYRRFTGPGEQNNWFQAADREELKAFISAKLISDEIPGIEAPYNYGEVNGTGRIFTQKMLYAHWSYLELKGKVIEANFNPEFVREQADGICYGDLNAKYIVYTMGIRALENNKFSSLPLVPSKGDYIFIEAPDLKSDVVLNAGVFIVPEGNGIYRVGATYSPQNIWEPSTEERRKLEEKLSKLGIAFKVVNHTSGIRPTVNDRRPIVGRIPGYRHSYIINGLGSRGVLQAPSMAQQLYYLIEEGKALWPQIDIARFNA